MTIFEKIAAGEIPSYGVYADSHVYAFLDIHPVTRGHTLVIPRQGYATVADLPADVAAALGAALPKVAAAVQRATGCGGYNVLCNNGAEAGQDVPHVHFHIIPRGDGGGDDGFSFRWPAGDLGEDDAKALQASIREAI